VGVKHPTLIWGSTCAVSTVIGGLALASQWLGERRFLDIARQAAPPCVTNDDFTFSVSRPGPKRRGHG